MADSRGDSLSRFQTMNRFMDQVTPQLQRLGVDPSGYRGAAQAYQSAVNNNLAVPQEFEDLMYKYGGFGNTGQQLFTPQPYGNNSNQRNPQLTQAGLDYVNQNLPEGMNPTQGYLKYMGDATDYLKGKGVKDIPKSFKDLREKAAGYGYETPQYVDDLAYASGFGKALDAEGLYKKGYGGGQKLFTPGEGSNNQLTQAGIDYASRNLPEGMSLSQGYMNYMGGAGDYLRKHGSQDVPKDFASLQNLASQTGYATPQYIQDLAFATGQGTKFGKPAPQIGPTTSAGATRGPEVKDDYFSADKFKQVQAALGSSVPKVDIDKAIDYFKRAGNNAPSLEDFQALEDFQNYMGSDSPMAAGEKQYDMRNFDKLLNRLEEGKNNIGSDAGQKEAAPQSSSNAPDFLDKFKKDLEAKAENEPATRSGTYAEVTGDTSTRGGRDRSSKGSRPRGPGAFGVGRREMSPEYKDKVSRLKDRMSRQQRAAERARDRGLSDYESRRSSSRRGTEFGPGRSRRDTSGSSYSDSRRDRSFERRGRSSRNRFGR